MSRVSLSYSTTNKAVAFTNLDLARGITSQRYYGGFVKKGNNKKDDPKKAKPGIKKKVHENNKSDTPGGEGSSGGGPRKTVGIEGPFMKRRSEMITKEELHTFLDDESGEYDLYYAILERSKKSHDLYFPHKDVSPQGRASGFQSEKSSRHHQEDGQDEPAGQKDKGDNSKTGASAVNPSSKGWNTSTSQEAFKANQKGGGPSSSAEPNNEESKESAFKVAESGTPGVDESEDTPGMRRFKDQFQYDDAAHEKIMRNVMNFPPLNINFSPDPIPGYSSHFDKQFERYKKDPRANFIEVEKGANFANYKTEIPKTKEYEFFENVLTIEEYRDLPTVKFPYLFTSIEYDKLPTVQNDKNKLINIDKLDFEKFYSGGIGGKLAEVFHALFQRALMLRHEIFPVLNDLMTFKTSGKSPHAGYLFTGLQGGGKSSLLLATTYFAYKQKFLVFYIPNGYYWINGIHFLMPSPLLEGYFEAPDATLAFVKGFCKANEEILKSMTLSQPYNITIRDETPLNTLYDLCVFMVHSDDFVNVCFKILLDELYNNQTVPMLFAVDDYNFFNDYSGFHFGDISKLDNDDTPKRVHSKQYVLVRGLDRILAANHPNKFFVCADSFRVKTRIPQPLVQRNALKAINLQRYTYEEMINICTYYFAANYTQGDPAEYVVDLTLLSGAKGRGLDRVGCICGGPWKV